MKVENMRKKMKINIKNLTIITMVFVIVGAYVVGETTSGYSTLESIADGIAITVLTWFFIDNYLSESKKGKRGTVNNKPDDKNTSIHK